MDMVRTSTGLALAAFLGGCALDDSGPVRSVFRPADARATAAKVIFVTDRAADPAAPGGFGKAWAGAASCGSADIVLPPARLAGEEEKWGYIARTEATPCAGPDGHLAGAMAQIIAAAKAKSCDTVLLFVHGFHTGFDGAVLKAGQIAHDAQTGCVAAAFSWSSSVRLDRYIADIEHSAYAEPLLEEFLRALADSGLKVQMVAHSVGARMSLAALSAIARGRGKVRPGFVSELVLAAPDIGTEKGDDDFAHLLRDAAPYAGRITLYASDNDAVLKVSQGAHGGVERAGNRPDYASHVVDVIDASRPPADLLDHSYFAMSYEAIYDMTLALRGVSLQDRLNGIGAWKPTLVQGETTALATTRAPRLITRILIRLVPLIP